MQFDDLSRHYRTLGIPEGSSRDEVKRAYRRLAMLTHPDQRASHGLDVATANERFRAVNDAYRALTT
jgi:DnaJ family protein B protein 5